jgi:hypothetical protein
MSTPSDTRSASAPGDAFRAQIGWSGAAALDRTFMLFVASRRRLGREEALTNVVVPAGEY